MTRLMALVSHLWSTLRHDTITRLFWLLYVSISVATFRHTAFGFASLEGGSFWWGALSALAVDAGMMLSASGLRHARSWSLICGLAMSAAASTFAQLLYAMSNAAVVEVAPGAEWMEGVARTIIDARVWILPALLPLLSIVYAFSAKSERRERDTLESQAARIRGQTDVLSERATAIWALERNGYGELTVSEVADLAGCSVSTAQRSRPK